MDYVKPPQSDATAKDSIENAVRKNVFSLDKRVVMVQVYVVEDGRVQVKSFSPVPQEGP